MKLYCFSGLGADWRAFSLLRIDRSVKMVFIEWIDPIENESLADYAIRIKEQIDESEPYSFLGLSFGGMVASELKKNSKPEKLILISSVTSTSQMPSNVKMGSNKFLLKKVPVDIIMGGNRITHWMFGTKTDYEKAMLNTILKDTETSFVRWAFYAISTWPGNPDVECIRIHGDNDRIIPLKRIKPDYVLKGGHLIIAQNAGEISSIINETILS